ncbi:DUF7539 family protein [Natronosalvus vescus]|uniref:DUF7539 family protein n=1 Tax=Natronosalvus vescus TaxID=2953881 RepID=UPI0020905180|nr:hypothetical protein [Natronosalvus vescus]
MATDADDRQLVVRAQSHLDEWTNRARTAAYNELFEGDESILTDDDVQRLDALDSALERQGGDGVWGTDRYGIHTAGVTDSDMPLGVVCVYHPQITADSVLQGGTGLDDETEERLNAALWEYSERVATRIEDYLEAFLGRIQD